MLLVYLLYLACCCRLSPIVLLLTIVLEDTLCYLFWYRCFRIISVDFCVILLNFALHLHAIPETKVFFNHGSSILHRSYTSSIEARFSKSYCFFSSQKRKDCINRPCPDFRYMCSSLFILSVFMHKSEK